MTTWSLVGLIEAAQADGTLEVVRQVVDEQGVYVIRITDTHVCSFLQLASLEDFFYKLWIGGSNYEFNRK